jgi:hypothetical protein
MFGYASSTRQSGAGETAAGALREKSVIAEIGQGGTELADGRLQRGFVLSAGEGTKCARLYDWAYLELADLDAEEYGGSATGIWTHGLLIRRSLTDGECAFLTTSCPAGTTMETLVAVEGQRWAIEDAFETAKTELGLHLGTVQRQLAQRRSMCVAKPRPRPGLARLYMQNLPSPVSPIGGGAVIGGGGDGVGGDASVPGVAGVVGVLSAPGQRGQQEGATPRNLVQLGIRQQDWPRRCTCHETCARKCLRRRGVL